MRYIKTYESFSGVTTINAKILRFEQKLESLIEKGIYEDKDSIELLEKFNDIKNILSKDCSSFISELKSSGDNLLFRGVKKIREGSDSPIDGLYVKTPRKNRMPLDTESNISDMFDDDFEQKFEIRLRSEGVFATKDPKAASTYSEYDINIKGRKSFIFFPIGDYEYFWNPNIFDLFSDIENEEWYYGVDKDIDSLRDEYEDMYFGETPDIEFEDWLIDNKPVGPYQNVTNIVSGYVKGGLDKVKDQEITFSLNKYYIVDEKYYYLLKDWIFGEN